MSTLTEAQQGYVFTLLILSAIYFIMSIVCLMWAYFRWGLK